jgi:hypothetical protein
LALTIPAILKLVWEMKIRPKLGMHPVESAEKRHVERPVKATGPLPGTVPARD